jgi:hypothetical protein
VKAAVVAVLAASLLAVAPGSGRSQAPSRPALPAPLRCAGCEVPSPAATWQWQLTGELDTTVAADVFDVDLFDTPKATVDALRRRGKTVVCYLSAGTWERWRPDAAAFPSRVLGARGWPDERWLDIRRLDLLAPIVRARLDECRAKGFAGVEFDNVDGWTNRSGFALGPRDQLLYNVWLANEAHRRSLFAVLKNDLEQARELLPYFDTILVEQCLAYDECGDVAPFSAAGKPAVDVEYGRSGADACLTTGRLRLQLLEKRQRLDAALRRPCAGGAGGAG